MPLRLVQLLSCAALMVGTSGCASDGSSPAGGSESGWSEQVDAPSGVTFSMPYPVDPVTNSGAGGAGRVYSAPGGPGGLLTGVAIVDDLQTSTREWVDERADAMEASQQPGNGVTSVTVSRIERHPIGKVEAYDFSVTTESGGGAFNGSVVEFRFTGLKCGDHGVLLQTGGDDTTTTGSQIETAHATLRRSIRCS